jgi:hypothetical protein
MNVRHGGDATRNRNDFALHKTGACPRFDFQFWKARLPEKRAEIIFHFIGCGNRKVDDYLNCSGGNSRPLRFFEVWRAALFLAVMSSWSAGWLRSFRSNNHTTVDFVRRVLGTKGERNAYAKEEEQNKQAHCHRTEKRRSPLRSAEQERRIQETGEGGQITRRRSKTLS